MGRVKIAFSGIGVPACKYRTQISGTEAATTAAPYGAVGDANLILGPQAKTCVSEPQSSYSIEGKVGCINTGVSDGSGKSETIRPVGVHSTLRSAEKNLLDLSRKHASNTTVS